MNPKIKDFLDSLPKDNWIKTYKDGPIRRDLSCPLQVAFSKNSYGHDYMIKGKAFFNGNFIVESIMAAADGPPFLESHRVPRIDEIRNYMKKLWNL